jgi:hypothetical protein
MNFFTKRKNQIHEALERAEKDGDVYKHERLVRELRELEDMETFAEVTCECEDEESSFVQNHGCCEACFYL